MLLLPFLPLFFHMALAAWQSSVEQTGKSKLLAQIMTSASAGYITVKMENVSGDNSFYLSKNISIPVNMSVMVSFKQIAPTETNVALYRYSRAFDPSSNSPVQRRFVVWYRSLHIKSDFAQVIQTRKLSVRIVRGSCISPNCFQLFFSFFPEEKVPTKLPNGFWNCSVDHYATFHLHLACNLETECEDGRDETEHCPFSGPGCHGLVMVCNSCFKFVSSLHGYNSNETDVNKRAEEYCNLLGGRISFPMCVRRWYSASLSKIKIHPKRLQHVFTGVYFKCNPLNTMYTNSLISEHRIVLHHAVDVSGVENFFHTDKMLCLASTTAMNKFDRCSVKSPRLKYGAVCEIKMNKTQKHSHYSYVASLISTAFVLSRKQDYIITCSDGQVTYTIFLLESSWYTEHSHCNHSHLAHHHPTFTCNDLFTKLSYTQVCDFIPDCEDKSDESFCSHPLCIKSFTCANHQCVSYDRVCDQMPHCPDKSDEKKCEHFRTFCLKTHFSLSPILINFDVRGQFVFTRMNHNESCPDSHYRCPGEFNDCLPVYTRCNGMYDCMDRQDEERCEEMTCPGFFRCRTSTTCVHRSHLCDDWPHCPMHDDELLCDLTCPVGCQCQGHSFQCLRLFPAGLFPRLRLLDATSSGMTLPDVTENFHLVHLVLGQCSLTVLPEVSLPNLMFLDLRRNHLQIVNMSSFVGLNNLLVLSLSSNPLTMLYTDTSSVQQSALKMVDLSFTKLTVLDSEAFSLFPAVQKLNLTFTSIHTISPDGFLFLPALGELYMDNSPVERFPYDIFKDLSQLYNVSTDNYKLCCREVLPQYFDESSCYAPSNELSSCEDLLKSWAYRGFLWLITCLSLSGNVFCFCARVSARTTSSSSGFGVFVINLTMGDFLMGVYIAIIGAADERFRGRYLHHDDTWKNSIVCKMAGLLSLLSSEVSALIICLITIDRFVVLRFPFSTRRFGRTTATIASLLSWAVGWVLALLPLLPMTSHWEFYSQTGICIPLPVTRMDFKGRFYSIGVLIIFNFSLFSLISLGQAFIYWSVQSNALKTDATKLSRDNTIAQRLISVAVTDFMCWFPIGMCGTLALIGVPVPGEVNVALAIFVLPLNSAINPFMYTFNTWMEKRRKAYEGKLLKWVEAHPEALSA